MLLLLIRKARHALSRMVAHTYARVRVTSPEARVRLTSAATSLRVPSSATTVKEVQ
jgi:hypothetical protein